MTRYKRKGGMTMCEICGYTSCHTRCPNRYSEILGECANCHCEIEADYESHRDSEGNLFCSLECALAYYSIEENE